MSKNFKIITLIVVAIIGQFLVAEFLNIWSSIYIIVIIPIIIALPLTIPPSILYIISFAIGLCVDFTDGVFGLNAAAATAMAFFRNGIIKLFFSKSLIDSIDNQPIIYSRIPIFTHIIVATILIFIYLVTYTLLDNPISAEFLIKKIFYSLITNLTLTLLINYALHAKYLKLR